MKPEIVNEIPNDVLVEQIQAMSVIIAGISELGADITMIAAYTEMLIPFFSEYFKTEKGRKLLNALFGNVFTETDSDRVNTIIQYVTDNAETFTIQVMDKFHKLNQEIIKKG